MRLSLAFLAMGAVFSLSACSDSTPANDDASAPVPVARQVQPQGEPDATFGHSVPQGTGFDFYVLALSWSPAYCVREGRKADPRQCKGPKPYGFIVHGLWPQFERGSPDYCGTGNPSRADVDQMLDLTPSPSLLRYQWEKHGSCSGLQPDEFYSVMRAAREMVTIPAQFANPRQAFRLSAQQVEQAFIRANPGLSAQSIAATCPGNDFGEVRICLTKTLQFRACPEVDRAGCRSQSISVEPMN